MEIRKSCCRDRCHSRIGVLPHTPSLRSGAAAVAIQEMAKKCYELAFFTRLLRQLLCNFLAMTMLYTFLMCISLTSYAGTYGDSCAPLPFTPDSYLQGTAYGLIRGEINGVGWSGDFDQYCNPDEPQFWIALRVNPSASVGHSEKFTFTENQSRTLGEMAPNNPALGGNPFLQNIVLTAKKQGSLFCLFMPTSQGSLPLACKTTSVPEPPPPDEECSNISTICYGGGTHSQSLFNFSGLAIECLKESLNLTFYQKKSCAPTGNEDINLTLLNSFPAFQETLKTAIRAALILYTMFFGFNLILKKDYANTDKIANFFIKFVLVLYFAVGLGPVTFQEGRPTQENGMLKYGLPFLVGATPEFAQIVFNAGGSKGLCKFDTTKYKPGYEFYALWDAIDCRIGYYLGMDLLYNIDKNNILASMDNTTPGGGGIGTPLPNFGSPSPDRPDALDKIGALKFFTVMFGFFMAGNIIVVAAGLMFCIIFLSIMLYFITHYLVCMITLYVMAYISPIFIPMALFQRTKSYFDAWLKICFSCALQPAVIAGFIAILVTLYDSAIFKTCEFQRHDYSKGEVNISTFELRIPDSNIEDCISSAGYKLLQYYAGIGWDEFLLILIPIISIPNDIFSLFFELIYVLVFSIIFYYFSKSVGQFAADITSGPIMDAVTVSPTKIVDLAQQAAAFVKDAAQTTQGKPPSGDKPKDDTPSDSSSSGGGGGPSDSSSSGGGGGPADVSSSGGGR